jgi:hypothetical protein
MKRCNLHDTHCRAIGGMLLICWLLTPISATAAVSSWSEPALDRWFHQGDSAPGLKDLMSTFANYEPGAGFTQARTGSFMLGFDTSDQIPLVAPQRYQINSIRFTLDYVDENRNVAYDPTADDLAAILGGTDDPGKPIELYGVGYANDYAQLGFGANDSQPPAFEESSPLWPNGVPTLQKTFNVYPLGDDGTGQLGNVFNSPGGEGVFEYDPVEEEYELVQVTKPAWNTTPWAVGTIEGLTPGANIPPLARLDFQVNLELPGVAEYFQQTLATGQVGVFIASLHDLTGFHEGGIGDFPTFHAKESLWVSFGMASPPTLEIDYTILPEATLPGDFDGDGDVDGDDLADWRAGYGSDTAGDADGDGDTDGRDFLIWQRNYTGPLAANSLARSVGLQTVPEPTSLAVVIFGIISVLGYRPLRVSK